MSATDPLSILIVEDEPKLAQLVSDYLARESYRTQILASGADVEPWVKAHNPSLILLDIMLPDKDGMTVCKEIRAFSDVPIVMLTARVEEIDRLLGLELGADDYICKPFSPREVVARTKAILRRVNRMQSTQPQISTGLDIDEEKFKATYHGHELDLTAVEFRLLCTMLHNPGKVYSRSQLLDRLYDDHRIVTERTVDTHIKNLRKKLEAVTPDLDVIRSIYGVGYKLEL